MDLRRQISNGTLGPGDLVPGEQDLCDRYKVSRVTSRRALNELAASGLVVRQRGRGTQVLSAAKAAPLRIEIEDLMDCIEELARCTTVQTVISERVSAGPDAARALELSPREKIRRIVRVRSLGNAKMAHFDIAMPMTIAQLLSDFDHSDRPVLSDLMGAGLKVVAAHQIITAASATPGLAQVLGVPEDTALIQEKRTVFAEGNRPVLSYDTYYRPEYYQFELTTRSN